MPQNSLEPPRILESADMSEYFDSPKPQQGFPPLWPLLIPTLYIRTHTPALPAAFGNLCQAGFPLAFPTQVR